MITFLIAWSPAWLEKVPNFVIPLLDSLFFSTLFTRYQEEPVSTFLKTGKSFSLWRMTGVSIIGAAITVILAFGTVILTDDTASKTFGHSGNEIVYHSSEVSENEVEKLGNILSAVELFTDSSQMSIVLHKSGADYELFFIFDESNKSAVIDSSTIEYFEKLRNEVQKFYPYNNIIVNLSVSYPTVLRRIAGFSDEVAEKTAHNIPSYISLDGARDIHWWISVEI